MIGAYNLNIKLGQAGPDPVGAIGADIGHCAVSRDGEAGGGDAKACAALGTGISHLITVNFRVPPNPVHSGGAGEGTERGTSVPNRGDSCLVREGPTVAEIPNTEHGIGGNKSPIDGGRRPPKGEEEAQGQIDAERLA